MSPESTQTSCRSFLDGVAAVIARFLEPLLDLWQVLKLCRFSVLTIVLAGVLLNWSAQGQELLIRLQTLQSGWATQNAWFLLSVFTWAWASWYWSRVIVSFQFPHWPPADAAPQRRDWILWYHRVLPRALGVTAILTVAVGFLWSLEGRTADSLVIGNGGFYLICAAIFGLVVSKRHVWATRLRRRFQSANRLLPKHIPRIKDPRAGHFYRNRDDLPAPTFRALLWSFVLLFLIPLIVFQTTWMNLRLAPALGPAFIVLLAAASWIPPGTMLIYWSLWHRIPILSVLFFYVLVVSPYNDNHVIRTIRPSDGAQPVRLAVADHFDAWMQRRLSDDKTIPGPIPVFFVAAEGGGIRAAYWTASVLSRIEQDRPDFGSHVFVISGVSGGSLGAAIFTALVADEGSRSDCGLPAKFLECARTMLRQDYLASTFGTLLYPDLLQRFLFVPVPYWDRGRSIELGWEQQWNEVTRHASNRFEQPFEDLWLGKRKTDVPGLILNTTSVEQGIRVLTSSLQVDSSPRNDDCLETSTGRATGIFDDVIDLTRALNKPECNVGLRAAPDPRTVRLSTAVNNSARFSFVSPAGTVNKRLHLVDGGYFENSGMTSLEEVYREVRPKIDRWSSDPIGGKGIMPIVLHISNEPELVTVGVRYIGPLDTRVPPIFPECIRVELQEEGPHRLHDVHRSCPPTPSMSPSETTLIAVKSVRDRLKTNRYYTLRLDRVDTVVDVMQPGRTYLDEVVTPFITMYRSQQARGRHTALHVERQTQHERVGPKARFIRFRLRAASANLPLGWTLSQESAREMDEQLEATLEACSPNAAQTLFQYVETCWPR